MVIAGLKNPQLKQVEMFTKKAYEKPKLKEILTTVGPVSSCRQAMVEPHPSRTRNIVQIDSKTNGIKMAKILCHCTMFSSTDRGSFVSLSLICNGHRPVSVVIFTSFGLVNGV